MTPARRKALQWFHDRGEVAWFRLDESPPSSPMRTMLLREGLIDVRRQGDWKPMLWSLTDKGRRMLHGDDK